MSCLLFLHKNTFYACIAISCNDSQAVSRSSTCRFVIIFDCKNSSQKCDSNARFMFKIFAFWGGYCIISRKQPKITFLRKPTFRILWEMKNIVKLWRTRSKKKTTNIYLYNSIYIEIFRSK